MASAGPNMAANTVYHVSAVETAAHQQLSLQKVTEASFCCNWCCHLMLQVWYLTDYIRLDKDFGWLCGWESASVMRLSVCGSEA